MTSKASNLNAGLNRLVWKEGENSTPTDFCATVSSTPRRERGSIPLFGLQSIIYDTHVYGMGVRSGALAIFVLLYLGVPFSTFGQVKIPHRGGVS
jgi:hypothetical protein